MGERGKTINSKNKPVETFREQVNRTKIYQRKEEYGKAACPKVPNGSEPIIAQEEFYENFRI